MQTVLVSGNQGYIGSVLVKKLVDAGYKVIGLDTGFFDSHKFVPELVKPHLQIKKDVRDVVVEDLEGIDAVIHLAAISNDPMGSLLPEITYDINHRGSVHLAQCAKAGGVKRFLFSSSCSMYGIAQEDLVSEEATFNPQTPYAESKVFAERDISKMADDYFAPVFLRNSTVFGVSPRMRFDLVVQNLAAYGYLDGVIRIMSDGTPWRPLIHIEDVSEAFCFLLKADRSAVFNQAFNVGNKENNIQVKTIAEYVKDVIPNTTIEINDSNQDDSRSYKVDFSKIYNLGFAPKWSVLNGVQELYETFKKIDFTVEQFVSDDFIRLRKYKRLLDGKMITSDFRLTTV